MKKIIIYLVLILLLTGCSGETFPEPQGALDEFITHWNDGNYVAMYRLLSTDAVNTYTEELFISRYKNISQGIGLLAVELDNPVIEIEEDTATLTYSLLFKTTTVPEFKKDYKLTLSKGEANWEINWDHQHIFPELSADQVVRVQRQQPKRGKIYDRNRKPLVEQGNVREVGVVTGKIENEAMLVAGLAELLQVSEQRIKELMAQSWVKPDLFVPIKRISEKEWGQKQEQILAHKGVLVNRVEGRVYHNSPSLAQTIGYISEINENKLEVLGPLGYRAGDKVGMLGLEDQYERLLAGTIGFTISIHDSSGQAVEKVAVKEVEDGSHLELTLDNELSMAVEHALGENRGSVIIMDVFSGDILAMAGKPGFDNNLFALGISSKQYQALQDLDSPFINRAVYGLYPPGSIFKPFTALMALSEDIFNPEDSWETPKRWQPDPSWGGYHVTRVDRPDGSVDLLKATKWSDNVYFADLSLKLGWDRFIRYVELFGFDQSLPFSIPTRTSYISSDNKTDSLLADSGYGQGELQTTPLHMALLYASLARGDGKLPLPRITTMEDSAIWIDTDITPLHISLIDSTLIAAVQDQAALAYMGNTGKDLRGKTGTAQISAEHQIGWFVCYFDKYVIVVTLEGDQTMSSRQALQVAKEILNKGF